jgi:hypothetical protein
LDLSRAVYAQALYLVFNCAATACLLEQSSTKVSRKVLRIWDRLTRVGQFADAIALRGPSVEL